MQQVLGTGDVGAGRPRPGRRRLVRVRQPAPLAAAGRDARGAGEAGRPNSQGGAQRERLARNLHHQLLGGPPQRSDTIPTLRSITPPPALRFRKSPIPPTSALLPNLPRSHGDSTPPPRSGPRFFFPRSTTREASAVEMTIAAKSIYRDTVTVVIRPATIGWGPLPLPTSAEACPAPFRPSGGQGPERRASGPLGELRGRVIPVSAATRGDENISTASFRHPVAPPGVRSVTVCRYLVVTNLVGGRSGRRPRGAGPPMRGELLHG